LQEPAPGISELKLDSSVHAFCTGLLDRSKLVYFLAIVVEFGHA